MSLPPVIGLTSYVEPGEHPHWGQNPAAVIDIRYVRAIERAGGVCVIVPPREDITEPMAQATVAHLDGLVVAGGGDVDPVHFGQEPHERVVMIRADRDASEIALVRAARAAGVPLLGICRGHQVMAVEAGGALVQHLEESSVVHTVDDAYAWHEVDTVAGTVVARLLGERSTVVTSHHQAVDTAPGYVVSARAADGVVEAIEDPAQRFCVGVQWHPERGEDPALFDAVVEAARAYRA